MSYFLKKTNNKKGTYLQIYESYYDPTRKCGAHRSYKPLGYVHELQATGIEDPIAVFTKEVQKLNQKCKQKKQAEKEQQIILLRNAFYAIFPMIPSQKKRKNRFQVQRSS